MADLEIRIPKDLGLSQEQINRLQENFQKLLADVVRESGAGSAAKTKPVDLESNVAARVKSKTEVV